MKKNALNNRGVVALTTMIILGAVLCVTLFSLANLQLSSLNNATGTLEGEMLFVRAEGCAEEALLRLKRDPSYSGDAISLDGAACLIEVSGSGETRDVRITAETTGRSRQIRFTLQMTPDFGIVEMIKT